VVANATAKYIRKLAPVDVTFVITGETFSGGEEDFACAEYLEALLKDQQPHPAPVIERVFKSHDAQMHLDPNKPEFPKSDLDYCTQIDAFGFTMLVTKENGQHIMRAVNS
jgi:2-phosphosulfolactate phosphatase